MQLAELTRVFSGLVALCASAWYFDISPETTPTLNTSLVIGLFVFLGALPAWHTVAKRNFIRRRDIRCPHCQAVPPVRYVKEMLADDRCPGCGEKVVSGLYAARRDDRP
jgi:hypothetical protein